jgi:hypothetical protein
MLVTIRECRESLYRLNGTSTQTRVLSCSLHTPRRAHAHWLQIEGIEGTKLRLPAVYRFGLSDSEARRLGARHHSSFPSFSLSPVDVYSTQ